MRRFSLINFLLFFTCVACAFVAWNNARELAKEKALVFQLRTQLGHLNVVDDSKLHVVNVLTAPPLYRWRVFVPENASYHFCFTVDGVENLASGGGGTLSVKGLPAGENIVSANLGYTRNTWALWFGVNNGSATEVKCLEQWKGISKDHFAPCYFVAGSQTHTIDPQSTEMADNELLLGEWRLEGLENLSEEHFVQLWIKRKSHTD